MKQYRTEVVADRVQFGPRTDGGSGGGTQNTDASKTGNTAGNEQQPPAPDYPDEEINPEDIPF